MRHRHVVAVHGVRRGVGAFARRGEVGDDLVAEEVEVDPGLGAAPLAAAQKADVESPRGRKIMHGKGQVEGAQAHRAAAPQAATLRGTRRSLFSASSAPERPASVYSASSFTRQTS